MSTRFVDANVFLRYLLADHPAHSPAARRLFEDVEAGRAAAWTTDLVIAELVFVLSSKRSYSLDRTTIRDLLLPILSLPGLHLPRKRLYTRIFELYTSLPIDYIDAYHAALVELQPGRELYSFDTDFDRVRTVHRLEPGAPNAT